jgi:tetratricopeptide (TPR) repeat protein
MEASGIALYLFTVSLLCAVLYLVIALITKREYTGHVDRIQRILYIIFIKTNLPAGILATTLNAFDVFRYGEVETGLLFCGIFFVLSFIMERLMDKLPPENDIFIPASVPERQNPLFAALELFNETAAQKSILLSAIKTYDSVLLKSIKTTRDNFDAAALLIKEYIRDEKQRNEVSAEKIKTCNAIFEKLGGSAALTHQKAKSLNAKLSSSCAALVSVENQETLLADINLTFAKMFNEQSIEVNKKIQGILNSLGDIAYKCAHLQSFPKPYKEMIGLYSVRIESVLKVLDRRKDYLIWKEHFQTGKACALTEFDRAIVELSEAIRIRPEYADSYFYRGVAYEYKDEPDYGAALQDYKKALELNPESGIYASCIEKIKLKTGASVQEYKL